MTNVEHNFNRSKLCHYWSGEILEMRGPRVHLVLYVRQNKINEAYTPGG